MNPASIVNEEFQQVLRQKTNIINEIDNASKMLKSMALTGPPDIASFLMETGFYSTEDVVLFVLQNVRMWREASSALQSCDLLTEYEAEQYENALLFEAIKLHTNFMNQLEIILSAANHSTRDRGVARRKFRIALQKVISTRIQKHIVNLVVGPQSQDGDDDVDQNAEITGLLQNTASYDLFSDDCT